ncbi:MAG TPA: glutamine synthetase beta-grasp domain-containing protein, partial [Isosphaeraceae bacterium]|nr:glutamine synthetase beta-grasp domain-containing protein [Isosphaeraceae bacterium]
PAIRRQSAVTPKEVLALIRHREVTTVDLRFMDFPGVWQHFSIPADALTEETFEEGLHFDGSSVMGWRAINEADILVVPQPETAVIDPFPAQHTLTMICNIHDPITHQDYTRDPRNIARKAISYMRNTGLADECLLAPELEFFVFDNVQFEQRGHEAFYHIDSVEGAWNRGRAEAPNLGYKAGSGLGYFPCPPTDSLVDLRSEMALRMAECGIATAAHFHEVATGGQCEIDLMPQPLVGSADQVMLAKYIIRNVARRAGKTATFMPKPLLAGQGYAGLSDLGIAAIGGLIRHARALCAFANPTTNSYKRLVTGFEAPTKISYSRRNRAAIIRVPVSSPNPRSRRIEYRGPDAAANPYLLFSAMLMAILDGIQNKIRPGEPLDKDIYDLQPEELETVPMTPPSLEASLEALRVDHEFLLRGDVFTPDVIDTWIWYKQSHEVETIRVRPHPYEFALYYDA